ncbi:MAG: hypothetical protein Q9225_007482, partial [Loekoesia sp. 1 TL-2023]
MESIPHASDPGDYGPGIVAGNIVVVILSTIAVGLRVLSRRKQRLSLEADDYLIFAALPFGWAMCICTLIGNHIYRPIASYWHSMTFIAVKHGLGRHIGRVPPQELVTEGQAFLASELIWAASIPIIKISILLLYIRIFGRVRYFKITAYIIGVFSICWSIMVILVCALQCRPVQFIWDKSIKGTCINAPLFFIIGSAPNTFTDFVLLALPLPAVWNLHTTRAQKISLTVIFLLGSLLVRLIQLITNKTMDVTWSLGIVSVWSTAEPNLGIVSACMPTMKPLLRRFLPQTKSRKAGGSKQSGSSSSKRHPSATTSFGSSGFDRLKIGRAHQQFRELEDDTSDDLTGGAPTTTHTYITSGDAGRENSDIPLDAIE